MDLDKANAFYREEAGRFQKVASEIGLERQ